MKLHLVNVILSYYLGYYDAMKNFVGEHFTDEDIANQAYRVTEHKFANDPMYALAWPQAKATLQPK